ncbi:MAG: DJ-1/PfpI family protein [Clostridium sp.]|nr:DJ-1/PfpI family protein [Clostridium sp.]
MALVYAFMADGLEEVECLATADILVRAGITVKLVSITGKREVRGSHGFGIRADYLLKNVDFDKPDMLFLPGGQPGSTHLMECEELGDALVEANRKGKRIAAICAAPMVLGKLGILKDKRATCYPGCEDQLNGAKYTGASVVTDQNITTSRGLGFVFDFGLELVRLLADPMAAANVSDKILYK